jgi:DNA-binding response OmpR family regulator
MLSTSSSPATSTITDVLLVDTDIAASMYGPSLREKYRLHTAATPEAALQQLTRNPPALVITELALGNTSGVDVCRHAKALPVPATVLVTTSDVSRVPDALEAGCDGVLLKPFALNLLHARIGRLLRGRLTDLRLQSQGRYAKSGNGDGGHESWTHGTNRVYPQAACPTCHRDGATCFEFSSHRRSWYACLHCKHVWMGKRQE